MYMNTKKDSFNKASVLVALTFVLGTITYAWTGAPEGTPPANNVDAPVNVGVATQLKSGALGIDGLFRSYGSAIFDGGVKISTGSGLGKILTSDAAGNASWTSTSSLGISGVGDVTSITGGACEVGQVVQSISATGTVTCGVDAGGGTGFSGILRPLEGKEITCNITQGGAVAGRGYGKVEGGVFKARVVWASIAYRPYDSGWKSGNSMGAQANLMSEIYGHVNVGLSGVVCTGYTEVNGGENVGFVHTGESTQTPWPNF